MRTNDEIIQLIEDISKEKNISISELARRVKMSKSSVSMYFTKKRKFPLDRADVFAKALNISPEYLIGVTPISKNTEHTIDLRHIASSAMAFDGHQLNDEDLDLITSVLEARMKNRDKE
ncbi:helix-turn-helix domain-containing protein [Streptococcus porcinus]|uniref:Helix-turn-helix transcriptional regulator n=1 Tax=Streptococcus porcinus TaxID=1340 RepID=A0A7V9WT62_STRPO|nr:helix-turn-helix transcriptional regulator [Streptococcus porcinus]MBA2796597.1 helix-turn-helix transcriptional regulator [Streptococcus porcinus]